MEMHERSSIYSKRMRRRHESDDESLPIDLNKNSKEVVEELLQKIVLPTLSKNKRLGCLNMLVRMCDNLKKIQVSFNHMLLCLQVPLFHEAVELRAGALRALRHLAQLEPGPVSTAVADRQLGLLLARSLDVALENRLERVHALRLVRVLLSVGHLPPGLVRCLVAIARDGSAEKDLMVAGCLACLCELGVVNPSLFISCGALNAVLRNVLECYQPQLSEALVGVVLSLLNQPATRVAIKSSSALEQLVAPLTDLNFRFSAETADHNFMEERESRLTASRLALVAILRSWPGLISFCQPGSTCLPSLIHMLHLPYPDIRKTILEIFYDLFCFPTPPWTDSHAKALQSLDPSEKQSSWQIYEGFVAAEGKSLLPPVATNRPNLVNNYFSIVLLTLGQTGLLERLVDVVITGDIFLSIQATILLGELLHLCSQLLPPESSHQFNCLPSLVAAVADPLLAPTQRKQASDAVNCLSRHHQIKSASSSRPHSLFLAQLQMFSDKKLTSSKAARKIPEEAVSHLIRDSHVLTKEFPEWDWVIISRMLKLWFQGPEQRKLEDVTHRNFIRLLLQFYKPTRKQFAALEADKPQHQPSCRAGIIFMEYLAHTDETRLLEEFLSDVALCLGQVVGADNVPQDAIFSPSRLMASMSQYYFLFLGRLLSLPRGRKILERVGIIQQFHDISNRTVHAKLLLSSLDYSQEGLSRSLLAQGLSSPNESVRIYSTNLMLVLLRLGLPDFHRWAIELLLSQLADPSKTVVNSVLAILDEACDLQANLEAMVSLRPSLLHLGLRGLMLLLRFLSLPSGFRFLRDANFLPHQLDKWKQVTNKKYVKVVESGLYESLTCHKHLEDGNYGRRSNTRAPVKSLFLPPHMYGQLACHPEGVALLEDCLAPQISALSQPQDVAALKAALWALGHVGMTPLGLPLVAAQVPTFIGLATSSPVLSVRGTCFYVLGLLGSTPEGADLLQKHGWSTVRRSHKQPCPIARDHLNVVSVAESFHRKYGISISSTDSEWPDEGLSFHFVREGVTASLEEEDEEDWGWEIGSKDRSSSYSGNQEKISDLRRRSISDLEVSRPNSSSPDSQKSLPRQRPLLHRASTYVPPKLSPDSMTSTQDIVGYLTLRDIQRKRVQSLCFQDDPSREETATLETQLDSSARRCEDSCCDSAVDEEEVELYFGVCVPREAQSLFSLTPASTPPASQLAVEPSSWKPHTDSTQLLALSDPHTGLILHQPNSCLLCVWDPQIKEVLPEARAQRREVIRLITNLSSSVGVKAAEQGLLCLKQQSPEVFQDICLYSEVSLHMASFQFRLKARRFIQELFLDLTFQKIIDLACSSVRHQNIPEAPGS